MALLPILEAPHPILAARAQPVPAVTDEIRQLLEDMAETMYAAPGVGLAAPQVGHSIRAIVFDPKSGEEDEHGNPLPHELYQLVNPEIIERSTSEIAIDEGCLSVPDMQLKVPRAERIRVRALDRDGQPQEYVFEDFAAIVCQHEMDHLDGTTIFDRASRLKRKMYLRRLAKARRAR